MKAKYETEKTCVDGGVYCRLKKKYNEEDMNEILLVAGICIGGGLTGFLANASIKPVRVFKREFAFKDLLMRGLAALLFIAYLPYLFSMEQMSNQIGLHDGVFSPLVTVLMAILKWLTYFSFAACMIAPFYNKKDARAFITFFVPVILLINGIVFKSVAIYATGGANYYDYRAVWYAICLCLAGCIAGEALYTKIREKDFAKTHKAVLQGLIFFGIWFMAFMPMHFPQLMFGYIGQETAGFTLTHRLLIYICIAFMFGGYYFMHKKSIEEKKFFVIFLALSGFMQYFSMHAQRIGVAAWPLHLCNTAIVLMLFAYIFKWNAVFYFTYLVNVLGALLAILMPNTDPNLITSQFNLVFWYNHTYAFVLPIFGVALGLFPRPNVKMMYKAIGAFTVYVLIAMFLNGWLNNSPTMNPEGVGVDYFFLYSDFFVDKFSFAVGLRDPRFIWRPVWGGITFKFYWLYNLIIWLVFIALMFVIWGVYTLLFNTADAHGELARRKKLMRVDHANLLKELDGRSVKEPLHPEGAHMIKFNNFSKTYAGTSKKAVENFNLEVHEGEVFGFIGHNGAGKSTTIKSLVGIQSITEGSIEVQGFDVARQPLEAKLQMGYVSDNHAVYENLTGREYISYVADLYMVDEKDKNERIEKYAKMFHLEKALDSEIKCYSHGMKQKTMVIGALIHNPKVWVLDEPLTGLDPTSSWQIKECMRKHADEGNIVFFSSHVIEVVEKICDRIAIISGGKICRVDRVEDILKEGISLEELYLQYAQKAVHDTEETEENTQEKSEN